MLPSRHHWTGPLGPSGSPVASTQQQPRWLQIAQTRLGRRVYLSHARAGAMRFLQAVYGLLVRPDYLLIRADFSPRHPSDFLLSESFIHILSLYPSDISEKLQNLFSKLSPAVKDFFAGKKHSRISRATGDIFKSCRRFLPRSPPVALSFAPNLLPSGASDKKQQQRASRRVYLQAYTMSNDNRFSALRGLDDSPNRFAVRVVLPRGGGSTGCQSCRVHVHRAHLGRAVWLAPLPSGRVG